MFNRFKGNHTCLYRLIIGMFLLMTITLQAYGGEKLKLPKALDDAVHPTYLNRNLTLKTGLPKTPEQLMVYRVVTPKVDIQWVKKLAKKFFGISGPVRKRQIIYVAEGMLDGVPFKLIVRFDTGSFLLRNSAFYKAKSKKRYVGDFPDPEESKKIALKFLRDHQMLPEDAYPRGVADNTEGADVMSVGLGRRLNGIEFRGAGAEIIVAIGRNGNRASVKKAWQKLVPFQEYEIITPESAVKRIKRGKAELNGQKGSIKDVKLVYYASPVPREYVQPIYFLGCKDEQGAEFEGLIEAVRTE